jgi:hypothetical protein
VPGWQYLEQSCKAKRELHIYNNVFNGDAKWWPGDIVPRPDNRNRDDFVDRHLRLPISGMSALDKERRVKSALAG